MLRRDWRQLVARAVGHGLGVNIGTNGSCVTPGTADDLARLRVKSVTVSMDSHRPEVHDRFRRLPGLHERAVRAIRLLVDRNVRVVVGFTPTRLNWTDGQGVIELSEKLGADAVNLSTYVPAGRGSVELALDPEQLRELLAEWIRLRQSLRGRIDVIWHDCRVGMLVPEGERRKYVGCGAGRVVARICPDGTVTPCVFLPTPIGSLRRSTFSEIWTGSRLLAQFRQRTGYVTGICADCEYLLTCGGCRAAAYAFSGGDAFAGDPNCWVKQVTDDGMRGLAEGEALPL